MKKILIVEDDLTFATMLKTWLGKHGFEVETCSSVTGAAKALLADRRPALVLSDLRLPDHDGLFLLNWIKEKQLQVPFIMMTSYADVQNAVEAMKHGASDYIAKPVQPDILLQKIEESLAPAPAQKETAAPAGSAGKESQEEQYLEGTSEAARQLYSYATLVAPTPMSVLITGASGTGKEYVARRIHLQSRRAAGPFVAIDCGALTKELAASELFGHVKGAFTGAVADKTGAFVAADGGTLFLDEVGNLGYEVQVQLLRAIQERRVRPVGSLAETEVDIRLICATNEDLPTAVARGDFREDLYHRINEFTLRMPLLRERGTDILLFADFFLRQANRELERDLRGFDAQAAEALLRHDWPGNLRELKNAVKRAALLAQGELISLNEISGSLAQVSGKETSFSLHPEQEERERILAALHAARGNKSKAAQLLGVDRKTIYNKIKSLGIEAGDL